ncbi:MAG: DNA double-strand break repair nuclease NurA [Tissierellia bacterium]|nr:DNA double-strand break repair nuclease NurA [Tissierellia bacterium]
MKMYSIDKSIKDKLRDINSYFQDIYNKQLVKKDELRKFIVENIAEIKKAKKLSTDELKKIKNITAVDGSFNRFGGNYPHYIDFYKAVAKDSKNDEIIKTFVDCPFYEQNDNREDNDEIDDSNSILSKLEIEAAIEAIEKYKPKVLMLDGGLIRYKIYAPKLFEKLKDLSIINKTIVVGIIKDIKTNMISRKFEELGINSFKLYDREYLYGVLKSGEYFLAPDSLNLKFSEGLRTAFANLSDSPDPIGIEIFDFEIMSLPIAIDLSYSLTPNKSRGIPIWIDIVDKEARLSDEMVKTSLKTFIDPEIFEIFLNAERNKRT